MQIPLMPQSNSMSDTTPQKPMGMNQTNHIPMMPKQNSIEDSSPFIQPGMTKQDVFNTASQNTQQKYGVTVPSSFLRSVHQQESSGNINPQNYRLSMGLTDAAKQSLGKDYLPDNSFQNVVQNASNFLATKSVHTYPNGQKIDLSTTPENQIKWYLQKYVGLLPGQTRVIDGQKVSYEQIANNFNNLLKVNNK